MFSSVSRIPRRSTTICEMDIYRSLWPNSMQLNDGFKGRMKRQSVCDSAPSEKGLNIENMNPRLIELQYAVRGPLVARALEIENELKKDSSKSFKKVIRANLGDAHAMGQKPITFVRQVLACMTYPQMIDRSGVPEDVKQRVLQLLPLCSGSVGCYSASNGVTHIRENVAKFIADRDCVPCDFNNVVITSGASTAIKYVLSLFKNNRSGRCSGIMIPIPQYPLYSATIAEFGLFPAGYYLDEEHEWGLDEKELERSWKEASLQCDVRAIVIINPGNPTGQVLTKENIQMVIKFAQRHRLFIFADEVYQHNVHDAKSKFHSFKMELSLLGGPYVKEVQLASFMSVSKGYMGECGLRGGWMEIVNMQPEVQAHLYKTISANLCASVLGQIAVDCCARPPKEGEPSYELFEKERHALTDDLKKRAHMIFDEFKNMKGFKCNPVQGAMYAFPKIELSQSAIAAAKKENKPADVFYAFKLLEETGICIVPGSGFGQKPGTYHFRTTILAQTPVLKEMLKIFHGFHDNFTKEYP